MSSMFEKYRNSRGNLSETIKEKSAKSSFVREDDPNEWKMGSKNPGDTYTIRFLPGPDPEELPYITVYSFNWKSPDTGKYYNERSRATIKGEKDPVAEFNSNMWSTENSLLQNHVRNLSRRQVKHYANILVLNDSANPDNNGKVFYFAYGKEIANIIVGAREPEFDDVEAIEAFDLFDEGADFTIRITSRKKDAGARPNDKMMISYEKSSFGPRKPLSTDERYIERVYNLQHDLQKLIAPETFKPYEVLLKKLSDVVGPDLREYLPSAIAAEKASAPRKPVVAPQENSNKPKYSVNTAPKTAADFQGDDEEEDEIPAPKKPSSPPPQQPKKAAPVALDDDDDDDDFTEYFNKMRKM